MTRRRFHFKLQPVRTVREHAELLAMKDLAEELRHAEELKRELGSVEGRLAAARRVPDESLTALELATRQLYLERIERQLDDARSRAVVQERHVEEGRQRLEEAAREVEVLDRLESRRRAAFVKELRHDERVAADEAAARMRISALGGAA